MPDWPAMTSPSKPLTPSPRSPWYGLLVLDGWGGTMRQRVRIVAETPKRYRIEAIYLTRLAGRSRYLMEGERTLVPKTAIRLEA